MGDPRLSGHLDNARLGPGPHAHERADAGRRGAAAGDSGTGHGCGHRRCVAPSVARHRRLPRRSGRPGLIDAHIYAACHLRDRSDVEVCTEELLIKAGGELAQHPGTRRCATAHPRPAGRAVVARRSAVRYPAISRARRRRRPAAGRLRLICRVRHRPPGRSGRRSCAKASSSRTSAGCGWRCGAS